MSLWITTGREGALKDLPKRGFCRIGVINSDKAGDCRSGGVALCTRFPQRAVMLCITCEQEFFFARKVCVFQPLCPVEKKTAGIVLICRPFPK